MQFIDDAEFQVAIDLDGGGKITSIKWREMEFTVPFRGNVLTNVGIQWLHGLGVSGMV